MASQSHHLHFVLFPLIAQGHLIPMFDIARMLARHGVIVTIVTTQLNAKRFAIPLARAAEVGLQIRAVEIQFSCQETGLPNEIESFDMLPSLGLGYELFMAANTLQEPVERLFEGLTPRPSCIISDMCLPYTSNVATKFGIPRISFNGFSCFCTLCLHNIQIYEALESVNSESELFVVPGLPDHIELASNHLPAAVIDPKDFSARVSGAEMLRYAKLDFPQFPGDDPIEWFNCVEQYFEYRGMTENRKISTQNLSMKDLSLVSKPGLIRTNKERIEHLDSGLGIVQDGLQRMEIGMNDKLHHLEEVLNQLSNMLLVDQENLNQDNHQREVNNGGR